MLFSKTGGQLMVCADCLSHPLGSDRMLFSKTGGQLMVCADCLSHPLGSDRMLFSKTGGQLMVCAVSVTSSCSVFRSCHKSTSLHLHYSR